MPEERGRDFAAHNEANARLWEDYQRGRPGRAPVTFSMNTRMILLEPALNPKGYTPRQYCEDPEVMWEVNLAFQKWMRENVPQDAEMGLPEEWPQAVYFFNVNEAAWFGCPLYYPDCDVPDTRPIFQERKELLRDWALPDPLKGNLMARAVEFYEHFQAKRGEELFEGRPVGKPWVPAGTDGPMTVACNLRGTTEVCEDLLEDEAYFHELMEFTTRGIIARWEAWARLAHIPKSAPGEADFFADDSISLLSPSQYREHVLPYHKRILKAFRGQGSLTMHLCGSASQHFKTLVDELGVGRFETGFPVDLGRVRRELGPGVELIGNLHPGLLKSGPVSAIVAAVKKLCESGVGQGGRFILSDGNNCAPGTPIAHFQAAYDAARHYGAYPHA